MEGHKWSRKNYALGYTSYGSIDQLHHILPTFKKLEKLIRPHVAQFIKVLPYDTNIKKIQMSDCWLNVMPFGAAHSLHMHPHSFISGVYYVEVPQNSSGLKFQDARTPYFMAAPPFKKTTSAGHFLIQAKKYDLVLFESWLPHEVPTNTCEEDRISISFNYKWSP
jgi:uncharacterized protein (TIGR02466 family)